ncbi:MAG: hypothetical protein AAF571_12530, partial [Verrucomicrobiota bacterium]
TTAIVGIYHSLLGLAGLLLPTQMLSQVSKWILGVSPEVTPQFHMIAKFSAAYLLVFGLMALILCKDPVKYRVLAIPVLILFGIRLLNKLIFFTAIGSSFGISAGRNVFAVICVALLFGAILLTLPKKQEG